MSNNPQDASECCPNCGAKTRIYKFSINRPLADVLSKMFHEFGQDVPVEIKTLGMTTSQWTNFQKLRYWGLISKANSDRGGVWKVTNRGAAFVRNELAIPKFARMFRNELVEFQGPEIFERDITEKRFKKKRDYIEESTPWKREA